MTLNSVHNSINIDNEASLLFDIQLLKNKSIDNEEDVLLRFFATNGSPFIINQ
jgi:hypothetical protein